MAAKAARLAAVGETVMQEDDAETGRQLRASLALPWHEAVDRLGAAALEFVHQTPHYRPVLRSIRYAAESAPITAASNERATAGCCRSRARPPTCGRTRRRG